MVTRAILVWFLLLVIAVAAGVLRVRYLDPRIGEQNAHIIGTLVVVVLCAVVIWLSVPWIDQSLNPVRLFGIGLGWLMATVGFEFLFGHFVAGHSWTRLLADYNLAAGRVWILVLLTLVAMPWLTAVVRRGVSANQRASNLDHSLTRRLANAPAKSEGRLLRSRSRKGRTFA